MLKIREIFIIPLKNFKELVVEKQILKENYMNKSVGKNSLGKNSSFFKKVILGTIAFYLWNFPWKSTQSRESIICFQNSKFPF
jgi:hypothetical protein